MIVARDKIFIGIPSYDSRIDAALSQALLACTEFFSEMPVIQGGNALIQLARNELAHYFLTRTTCEWFMSIDSDIRFRREDWQLVWEGEEDIVCAEYSYKYLHMNAPVKFGLGFTRTHRSVFERIAALKTDDGQDLVRRFYHKGEMMVDFYTQHVSTEGRFVPEDHGFFRWAHVADATMRIETRTRLGHVGQFCFEYPDKIPVETLAQFLMANPDYSKRLVARLAELEGAQ